MKKPLLLSLLLLLAATPTMAQSLPTDEHLSSSEVKQRLREQYPHSDTAQALITLYTIRQAGGRTWISSAITGAVTSVVIGSLQQKSGSPYYQTTEVSTGARIGIAALVLVPFVGYGVAKRAHYSNAHLAQVLARYAAGQPLPHSLRRKLKPRFFKAYPAR